MRIADQKPVLDISKVPPSALTDVAKRGHTYAEIERMSPETFFDEYCRWHGLIGWGPTLWELAENVRNSKINI